MTMGKIDNTPADSKTGAVRMYIDQADGKIAERLINRHPQPHDRSTKNLYRVLQCRGIKHRRSRVVCRLIKAELSVGFQRKKFAGRSAAVKG